MDFIVPGVRQYPAHPANINVRPSGIFWEGFVCHTTVGGSTLAGLGAWFAGGNLRAGLSGSTTYGVSDELEDVVGQFVQLNQQPIAHGAESHIRLPIMRGNEHISTNAYLIGYELLDNGVAGNHTPRQLDRLARHMAHVYRTVMAPHAHITGAKVDRDHVLGHYQLAPSTRTCPVWPEVRFQWLIARVNALLAEAPEPIPPEPEPVPPEPVPPHDEWKYRFSVLADEAAQWNIDDAEQADWAVALRQERIQAIARGEI